MQHGQLNTEKHKLESSVIINPIENALGKQRL